MDKKIIERRFIMKKIKLFLPVPLTLLYIFTLFLKNRKVYWLAQNKWLNGWEIWLHFRETSSIVVFVLLVTVLSFFLFRKFSLSLLCLLLSSYILKFSADAGGLFLVTRFGGENQGITPIFYLNFILGIFGIIAWICHVIPEKRVPTRVVKSGSMRVPILVSAIYFMFLIATSRLDFLTFLDKSSFAAGDITPVLTWRLLLIILVVLLVLANLFSKYWTFPMVVALFGTFNFRYIMTLLSHYGNVSFYALALLGNICLVIWLVYFYKLSERR